MKKDHKIHKIITLFSKKVLILDQKLSKFGRPKLEVNKVLFAILQMVKQGLTYRFTSDIYNISKSSLHKYFQRWQTNGLFNELRNLVLNHKNLTKVFDVITDTTCVNLPYVKHQKYNGAKKKKCVKIAVFMTAKKRLFFCDILDGNRNDRISIHNNLDMIVALQPRSFFGDKAYFSEEFKKVFEQNNINFCVNNKGEFKKYKKRVKIEHFFASLKQIKAIKENYCRSLDQFYGFLDLALCLIS